MEWIETKIYTSEDAIEAVCAMLMETGVTGVQIDNPEEVKTFIKESSKYWDYVGEELINQKERPVSITAYVSNNPYGMEIFAKIKEGVERLKTINAGIDMGSLAIETSCSDDEIWLNKWKEYYKPLKIGKGVIVVPIWEENFDSDGRSVIKINPGHVFGTGLHQTTQLCIEGLEKYLKNNDKVLDLGCGSGILSVAALILGADTAFAVDIDENAVKTAYENAQYNHIYKDRYTVVSGNAIEDKKLRDMIGYEKYDIITANIIADVIISFAPLVKKHIKKGGIFISSGIIKDREKEVSDVLYENGFTILEKSFKDEWVSITAKEGK